MIIKKILYYLLLIIGIILIILGWVIMPLVKDLDFFDLMLILFGQVLIGLIIIYLKEVVK